VFLLYKKYESRGGELEEIFETHVWRRHIGRDFLECSDLNGESGLLCPGLRSKQGTHAVAGFMATTRSRTGLFLSYRDSQAPRRHRTSTKAYDNVAYNDDENEQLIQNNHISIDIPVLPPKWFIIL
jgi:hypothetical protein